MKYFNRRAVTAWVIAGAVLLAWSGVATLANAGTNAQYHDDQRQATRVVHFWRVVAGKDEGGSGVANKLARDLHDLQTYNDLISFRGDSNRYGGITDELGFDPFHGEDCHECGPLSIRTQAAWLLIKKGDLNTVVRAETPAKPDTHPGTPLAVWFLWILTLPALMFIAYARESRKHNKRNQVMPNEMALIHDMDRALGGTFGSPQERYDLQQLRNRLMTEVDERVKYGEMAGHKMKVDELTQEALDSLDAIQEGNKVLNQP